MQQDKSYDELLDDDDELDDDDDELLLDDDELLLELLELLEASSVKLRRSRREGKSSMMPTESEGEVYGLLRTASLGAAWIRLLLWI
jgi:hypothetical protein